MNTQPKLSWLGVRDGIRNWRHFISSMWCERRGHPEIGAVRVQSATRSKGDMTDLATLRRARKSFEQRAWAESYRLLQAADRDAPLDAEDLERLAIAAYLVGRDDECEAVSARAHQAFLDRGDREGAARSAFWLGFSLMRRGAIAPASGWFARAERLLDEGQLDCAVRGYLLIPSPSTHCAGRSRQRPRHIQRRRRRSLAALAIAIWRRWPATDVAARSSASDALPKVSRCSMKRWRR